MSSSGCENVEDEFTGDDEDTVVSGRETSGYLVDPGGNSSGWSEVLHIEHQLSRLIKYVDDFITRLFCPLLHPTHQFHHFLKDQSHVFQKRTEALVYLLTQLFL